MLNLAVLVVSLTALPVSFSLGDEASGPVTGEVRLASGRAVNYAIHYDRNSLRESVRSGDSLIALTSSGALLRFELPAIRLVRERIDVAEITCLGRGEGETVLAGLSDGHICRVDPVTLALTDLAKLPTAPLWVGWRTASDKRPVGLVAVTTRSKQMIRDGQRVFRSVSVVHDFTTGLTHLHESEAGRMATTFLLDRAGRLWLGADHGEWGGWVTRIDLSNGTNVKIKPPPDPAPDPEDGETQWDGVYGFIERHDGQILAFGGTSHFGMNSGFITRVDQAEPHRLFAFEPPLDRDKQPDLSRPRLPITHVVEEDKGLFVLSYSDVFRVDLGFTPWKKVATLEIAYRWGRRDAIGSYPSVRVVHPPKGAGGAYLFGTVGDGYVSLEGAKATAHSIAGQLGASRIDDIKNTSEGTFFFEYDDRLPCWRLGAQGWGIASLAPPMEPDPQSDFAASEKEMDEWYETHVLVSTDGMIYTVSGTGSSPGTRTTARRVNGKPERIGRETSSLNPGSSFMTDDGTLWNAFFGELKRFEKGRWDAVARLPESGGPSGLKPLNQNGSPWLLLNRGHNLWRMDHGAKGENPGLSRIDVQEAGKTPRISDGIPWSAGTILLATSVGLRKYDLTASRLSRVDLPEPSQPVTTLVRDRRGRLWLGGKGLSLFDPATNALETLESVPAVGRNAVYALAPDPSREDGVIVALGPRGVAFVRAGQRP